MNDKIYSLAFALPAGLRIYAIGDIHGYLSALDNMHDAISADLLEGEPPQKTMIVYLGDYVDRGPASSGVLDRLIERQQRGDGIPKVFLSGNHEIAMMEFMRNPHSGLGAVWLDWGGFETLLSYGVSYCLKGALPSEKEAAAEKLRACMPQAHLNFLSRLESCFRIGGFFFAHAGVNPEVPLGSQSLDDLTFIREPFLGWNKPLQCMVVHGHTITPNPVVEAHRIGIDTGVYLSGTLTAAVIEGQGVQFLQVRK